MKLQARYIMHEKASVLCRPIVNCCNVRCPDGASVLHGTILAGVLAWAGCQSFFALRSFPNYIKHRSNKRKQSAEPFQVPTLCAAHAADSSKLGAASLAQVASLDTPFPLSRFEEAGLPAAGRFLWWEYSRCQGSGRKPGLLRSGLHALDLDEGWLEVSTPSTYAEAMAGRRQALAEQRELALVSDDASLGAQQELLHLLLDHLARKHPKRFSLSGEGANRQFESCLEGISWRLADYAECPLLLAGQLVQEDICLMHEVSAIEGATSEDSSTPKHIFTAGVVMESFNPVEKHLLPMLELHGPVPGYATDLHASMERVFANLRKPVWRANFSFAEWRYEDDEDNVGNLVERLYFKTEYETLRRLPSHPDYMVFTIRAHADPLPALALEPQACAALAFELQHLPQALLAYRGLGDPSAQKAVLEFLEAAALQHNMESQPNSA